MKNFIIFYQKTASIKAVYPQYKLRIVNTIRTKVREDGEIYVPDLASMGRC
jgi:hypothetical protein